MGSLLPNGYYSQLDFKWSWFDSNYKFFTSGLSSPTANKTSSENEIKTPNDVFDKFSKKYIKICGKVILGSKFGNPALSI